MWGRVRGLKVIDDADSGADAGVVVVAVAVVYAVVVKRREEKRREGKGREKQEQEQETQAISSRDYTEEERRAHRMIAPKQKGEKHQSAGEEQERNKEANNIKNVQGLKNQDHTVCARVKTWYINVYIMYDHPSHNGNPYHGSTNTHEWINDNCFFGKVT